jgi:hypothetical protein
MVASFDGGEYQTTLLEFRCAGRMQQFLRFEVQVMAIAQKDH